MTKDRLFSICILLFSLVMYIATFDFAAGSSAGVAGPAVFPRVIIGITAFLAAITLAMSFRSKSGERIALGGVPHKYRSVGAFLVLFLLYVTVLPVTGFVPATLGFMFIGQLILTGAKRKREMVTNILVTVLSTYFVYFVFTEGLNILLP